MKQMKTNWTVAVTLLALTVIVLVYTQTRTNPAHAQQPGQASAIPPQANPMVKLLDPKDTVVLLLDHQTGLFQTVKDVPVRDLRANTVVLAKIAELAKAPIITTASEPERPQRPADVGTRGSRARTPSTSRAKARSAPGTMRTSERPSKATGKQDAHHGRRVDERVRRLSRAPGQGRRLQGVRGDRRLGRHERDGFASHARPHDAGRHHPRHHERGAVRVPAHVGPAGRRGSGARSTASSCRTTAPSSESYQKAQEVAQEPKK